MFCQRSEHSLLKFSLLLNEMPHKIHLNANFTVKCNSNRSIAWRKECVSAQCITIATTGHWHHPRGQLFHHRLHQKITPAQHHTSSAMSKWRRSKLIVRLETAILPLSPPHVHILFQVLTKINKHTCDLNSECCAQSIAYRDSRLIDLPGLVIQDLGVTPNAIIANQFEQEYFPDLINHLGLSDFCCSDQYLLDYHLISLSSRNESWAYTTEDTSALVLPKWLFSSALYISQPPHTLGEPQNRTSNSTKQTFSCFFQNFRNGHRTGFSFWEMFGKRYLKHWISLQDKTRIIHWRPEGSGP